MKFFVSGKIGVEGDAKEVMEALRTAGHEITFDWTAVEHLKPYDEKAEACRMAAVVDVSGVKEADVFVIIPHERGIGMYIELGIAINSEIPIRVVVNSWLKSCTRFLYHPLVKRVSGVQEIIEEFSEELIDETETR